MRLGEIRDHLCKFRVGIAGAGGLGSSCAVALARCGVGTLIVSDFDIIEEANLSRQFYFTDQLGMDKVIALKHNIKKVNPSVSMIGHKIVLNRKNIPEIYKGCDVIVEAFDSAEMKEMLIETVQKSMPGIPVVVGSGMAGWGKNELLKYRKIDDFLYVCGDETTEVSDEVPPLAPRVGIVSHMQANTVIEILMKKERPKLKNNESFTE
jgi:sulfur carrier protein ThiS adenylyltransferase